MGFASGSVSFRRFIIVGEQSSTVAQAVLDQLAEYAFKATEMGIPEEVEYGWCGRDILDVGFSFENNVYNDCLFFGMRIDTNKVPGDLKRAWARSEEAALAAGNPSGFISKAQKKDVKDTVRQKAEDEMRGGRFRRSKVIPLLWDFRTRTLYAAVSGSTWEMLAEIFERTFGLSLVPLTAGSLALRHLEPAGRRRDYEDLRPTRFVPGPEGEGQYPEYPWVAKGPEPKDFVGNEFFMFLLLKCEVFDGELLVADEKPIDLFIDRQLDLDCAYGQTGTDSIRGDGPARTTEAKAAFKIGKVPRKMGLHLVVNKMDFGFTFSAESFAIASAKLPDVEDAETPRVLFEERITLLRELSNAIDAAYCKFIDMRITRKWPAAVDQITKWVNK